MAKRTFKFINTAGHGYLVVPNNIIKKYLKLLIDTDKLSDVAYSYWHKKNCFLEEDTEAIKFLEWYENDIGVKPVISETYQEDIRKTSPINWVISIDQQEGSHFII